MKLFLCIVVYYDLYARNKHQTGLNSCTKNVQKLLNVKNAKLCTIRI